MAKKRAGKKKDQKKKHQGTKAIGAGRLLAREFRQVVAKASDA